MVQTDVGNWQDFCRALNSALRDSPAEMVDVISLSTFEGDRWELVGAHFRGVLPSDSAAANCEAFTDDRTLILKERLRAKEVSQQIAFTTGRGSLTLPSGHFSIDLNPRYWAEAASRPLSGIRDALRPGAKWGKPGYYHLYAYPVQSPHYRALLEPFQLQEGLGWPSVIDAFGEVAGIKPRDVAAHRLWKGLYCLLPASEVALQSVEFGYQDLTIGLECLYPTRGADFRVGVRSGFSGGVVVPQELEWIPEKQGDTTSLVFAGLPEDRELEAIYIEIKGTDGRVLDWLSWGYEGASTDPRLVGVMGRRGELEEDLAKGEGPGIEFKPIVQPRKKSVRKEDDIHHRVLCSVVALGNGGGGTVWLGVTDYATVDRGVNMGAACEALKRSGVDPKGESDHAKQEAYLGLLRKWLSDGLRDAAIATPQIGDSSLWVFAIRVDGVKGSDHLALSEGDIFHRVGATNKKGLPPGWHHSKL
ncbi:hypothetical protein IIA16_01590 [bacterium]|nr:hypothetical protein [bacterium]